MEYQRAQRIGYLLKEEISTILRCDIKDPRVGFVTITEVDVSPDLRLAKVYYTVYGDAEDHEKAHLGLKRAANYVRNLVGQRVRLKYTPQLIFVFDRSTEYGFHIQDLLDELQGGDSEE